MATVTPFKLESALSCCCNLLAIQVRDGVLLSGAVAIIAPFKLESAF